MTESEVAILNACFNNKLDETRFLLAEEPGLADTQSDGSHFESGSCPLGLASGCGHSALVDLLLEAGADPNLTSKDGSPLLMAAWGGDVEITRKLLESDADTNIVSESGESALMAAAIKGHFEIGRQLIEHGAIVDAQTTEGTTDLFMTSPPVVGESALHLAAAYGHREFVDLLLENKADKTIKDHQGQTPANWAGQVSAEGDVGTDEIKCRFRRR
jgi:ankyrin repeat protein